MQGRIGQSKQINKIAKKKAQEAHIHAETHALAHAKIP